MSLSGKDRVVKQWNWIKETNTATGSDKEWQKNNNKKKQMQKPLEPVYVQTTITVCWINQRKQFHLQIEILQYKKFHPNPINSFPWSLNKKSFCH